MVGRLMDRRCKYTAFLQIGKDSNRKKSARKAKCLIYKAVTQNEFWGFILGQAKVLIYKAVTQNGFLRALFWVKLKC